MPNYHTVEPNNQCQNQNLEVIAYQDENPDHQEYVNDLFNYSCNGDLGRMESLLSFLDPNIVNISDCFGATPLHYAVARGYGDVVMLLLEQQNIDKNPQDNEGLTPLHLAAERGDLNLIKYLMGRGADINIPNFDGKTPKDWLKDCAEETGNLNIVSQMLDEIEGGLIGQNNYPKYYIPEN